MAAPSCCPNRHSGSAAVLMVSHLMATAADRGHGRLRARCRRDLGRRGRRRYGGQGGRGNGRCCRSCLGRRCIGRLSARSGRRCGGRSRSQLTGRSRRRLGRRRCGGLDGRGNNRPGRRCPVARGDGGRRDRRHGRRAEAEAYTGGRGQHQQANGEGLPPPADPPCRLPAAVAQGYRLDIKFTVHLSLRFWPRLAARHRFFSGTGVTRQHAVFTPGSPTPGHPFIVARYASAWRRTRSGRCGCAGRSGPLSRACERPGRREVGLVHRRCPGSLAGKNCRRADLRPAWRQLGER